MKTYLLSADSENSSVFIINLINGQTNSNPSDQAARRSLFLDKPVLIIEKADYVDSNGKQSAV